MYDDYFKHQSSHWSQAFLRSQTHLLKGLLTDKGGDMAGCKSVLVKQWLTDNGAIDTRLEREFKALIKLYDELLAEPRPFNLRRVKSKGKPVSLQWRLPMDTGSQVVVALFDEASDLGQKALSVLPATVVSALLEIESWRLTLNWIASLRHFITTSTEDYLIQQSAVRARRQSIQLLPETK